MFIDRPFWINIFYFLNLFCTDIWPWFKINNPPNNKAMFWTPGGVEAVISCRLAPVLNVPESCFSCIKSFTKDDGMSCVWQLNKWAELNGLLSLYWRTLSKMTTTCTTTMANSITSRCTTRLYYDLLTTPKPYRSPKKADQTKTKSIWKSFMIFLLWRTKFVYLSKIFLGPLLRYFVRSSI